MKRSLPLYGTFLAWLITNILFVACATFIIVPSYYGLGWNVLLTTPARESLQILGERLASAIGPVIDRDLKVDLQRYEEEYGLRFGLFAGDGRRLAGREERLPATVASELLRTEVLMFAAIPGPLRSSHAVLAHAANDGPLELPAWPPLDTSELRRQQFVLHESDRWWIGIRVARRSGAGKLLPTTVLVDTASLRQLVLLLGVSPWLIATAVIVTLSILFWLPLLWSISRATTGILRAVERIADGDFEARSDVARGDELGRLARAVDSVGARLESFVKSQRHFLADIAHEVRSPLGRLQLGLGILEEHLPKSAQPTFADVYEEAQVMSELVDELLTFSRTGVSDAQRLPALALSLKGLVLDALEREDAREHVLVNVPEPLQVRVNTSLLVRAVANLVRNALRYAGTQGGPIEVVARQIEQIIELRVMDRGPGVPELALLKLGDPFYRPESARSRSSGGIGLGLATVRNCITSCGGKVVFRNRVGGGFEAEIQLPIPDA